MGCVCRDGDLMERRYFYRFIVRILHSLVQYFQTTKVSLQINSPGLVDESDIFAVCQWFCLSAISPRPTITGATCTELKAFVSDDFFLLEYT